MNRKPTLRLLYAEQDPQDADLTCAYFAEHAPEFELQIVTSAAACLEQIQRCPPDLLLLCHRLPDQSGLDFFRAAQSRFPRLPPCILIADSGDEAAALTALKLGADDYVIKREGYLNHLGVRSASASASAQARLNRAHEQLEAELAERQAVQENLQTHQIELEVQNEALREAKLEVEASHAELEASHARYLDLYDFAPIGYCTVNHKGLIINVNFALATLLGATRSKLVGRPLARFMPVPDADSFCLLSKQFFAPPTHGAAAKVQASSCELCLKQHDGALVWVSLAATAATEDNGETVLRVVLSDISLRKQAEQAQQTALQEKTALLQEIHHRVKNNLQVIASLLRLEGFRSEHDETKAVLNDMQGRIRAMALLHENIYRKGNFAAIDLGLYLSQIAGETLKTLLTRPGTVQLQLNAGAVQVGLDQATPCGMLISEFMSNCLKHAFPEGRSGTIEIALQPLAEPGLWRLRVSDTGVGLPADFASRREKSLGLQLAGDLAMQMGGKLHIGAGPQAVFSVEFKAAPPRTSSDSFHHG